MILKTPVDENNIRTAVQFKTLYLLALNTYILMASSVAE